MKVDLTALDPAPTAMVANLPYSVATPLILRTIAELPSLASLDRDGPARDRRAAAGAAGLALLRVAERASSSSPATCGCCAPSTRPCSTPRPRVDSAVLALTRRGAGVAPGATRS